MNFKKAISMILFSMTLCGFPLSKQMKGKCIFKLIRIYQFYISLYGFYFIYRHTYITENQINYETKVRIVMQYVIKVIIFYFLLVLSYFYEDLISLIDKFDNVFAEMEGKATADFLKSSLIQQIPWFIFQSFFTFEAALFKIEIGMYVWLVSSVWTLTVSVITCEVFLFDHLSRFKVKHDLKRLTRLIHLHRLCCDVARLANKIFKFFISAILSFNVLTLIYYLAFLINNIHKGTSSAEWKVATIWVMLMGVLLLYMSLRSANINNKLNASLDHILSVSSSFQSPILTTKKSLALMAKLDLYVAHVTLSECYMSVGGFIQIQKNHVITILGLILSNVVLIIDKHSKEETP